MNQKDKKEIGLNMAVLMDSVLYQNLNADDVANKAITFCSEMLKKYPDLKEYIEGMVANDWDKNIAWINWERDFL
jgi:hypothetical protein